MNVKKLLYKTERGTVVTDTLHVAEEFGRQHKNMRKSALRLIKAGHGAHFYEQQRGKFRVFVMDIEGFAMLTATLPNIADERTAALQGFHNMAEGLPVLGQHMRCKADVWVNTNADTPATIPDGFTEQPEATNEIMVLDDKGGRMKTTEPDIAGIIPLRDNPEGYVIDGRQLHRFLGNNTDFVDWFKYRCTQYGFTAGVDYAMQTRNVPAIGRPLTEYWLTLDTAKELAMVEGTEAGRMARRYFIECEKRLRAVAGTMPALPRTFAEALRLAATQAERIEKQQQQIEADAPKVAFANAIITSPSNCGVDELAKMITQNGVDMGEIRLFAWLRKNGYLCAHGTAYNQPTQKALEMGLFTVVPRTWTNSKSGETITTTRTMVTGKGKQYFINKFVYKHENGEEL